MRLILTGIGIMVTGLALLMAMVVELVAPGLFLSLGGYAVVMSGLFMGVAGAIRYPPPSGR